MKFDHLMSPTQAAQHLGISAPRVRQLLDAGEIDHVVTPLGRLIDGDSVEAFRIQRAERRAARAAAAGR